MMPEGVCKGSPGKGRQGTASVADRALALEVRRLALVVADLAEDLRHAERRQLEADDRRVGAVLVPLAGRLMENAPFTVPGLFEAAHADRSAQGQALSEVLADYGSLRAVGKLLARLDGRELAGWRLVPQRESRDGRVWRLVRVSDE